MCKETQVYFNAFKKQIETSLSVRKIKATSELKILSETSRQEQKASGLFQA